MIKIRAYEHTDRYIFSKLVNIFYEERKMSPISDDQISETLAFFNAFPQCGKIFFILYDEEIVGYAIVCNLWKNRFSKIFYLIDELYIDKNYKKYRLEVNLIDFLVKSEKIYGISIRFDQLNSSSKKIFKTVKFKKDSNGLYLKILEM
ncbi:MAG TPA: hypothetical protein PK771_12820 [Spirochaetota bacterium]|nr:hypothetical protein [Spirochaetota bacterium]